MKSEPSSFSIDDLARAKNRTAFWDGVRNYQARNFLRDDISVGDGVIIYHSNAEPSAAVGTAVVVGKGRPDATQFDASDHHFDADSPADNPRWFGVDVKWESTFARPVSLDEIKRHPGLADMVLVKRGRLSVQPVTARQWAVVVALGGKKA